MKLISAAARIPLTCGEFVQGTFSGTPALISCPIDAFHSVKITIRSEAGWIFPSDAQKVNSAYEIISRKLPSNFPGAKVEIHSPFPRERGYGTSTADITAFLYAYAKISNRPITHDQAAEIALSIEPTDSSLYPDLTLFAYRSGKFKYHLDPVPPFEILIADPGGGINTVEYNARDHSKKLKTLTVKHHSLFQQFQTGLAQQDWELIGAACTDSAVIHQEILPNPYLDQCLQIAENCGALGICRAHSGTIIGLLFRDNFGDLDQAKSLLKKHLPNHFTYRQHRCTSGGPRYDIYKENL